MGSPRQNLNEYFIVAGIDWRALYRSRQSIKQLYKGRIECLPAPLSIPFDGVLGAYSGRNHGDHAVIGMANSVRADEVFLAFEACG